YRGGSDTPAAYLLPGIAPDAAGHILGAAVKLGATKEAGALAVGDFDGDGAKDLAITEPGGVRILYAHPPAFTANTTPQTARDLGTVAHFLGQAGAIVPGFRDSYYTLTVPHDSAPGSGAQVLDFSALFADVQGA